MNLLFVTNNLYPYQNANSEIAYKLASVLKSEYNCHVTVLGYSDKERNVDYNPYGVAEYEMYAIGLGRRIMAKRENRIIKLLRLLSHPSAFLYVFHRETDSRYILKSQYCKAIRKFCKKNNVDCIVCFKNPNDTLAGAIEANTDEPIIAYELDPWENAQGEIDNEVLEQQYSLEEYCTGIITTKLLYPNYLNQECKTPKEKVTWAEFPNITEYSPQSAVSFSDGKIHCVFTGQLYDDIRNPKFTIELFSKLEDADIVLDIFGNDNGCLKDIDLPGNIVYHGEVKSEDAMAYLYAADVVVNIGNTLMNQMPSKILTCISSGKPILNIIKDANCPTLQYMNKYPLALSVLECGHVTNEVLSETKLFFDRTNGQKLSFNSIKELFKEATPEYVGGQLLSAIEITRI